MKSSALRLLASLLCLPLCACAWQGRRIALDVTVSPDANDDRPVSVDLVFVWSPAMVEKVGSMPAKDWFEQKSLLRQNDPRERAFSVREWEWVPGQAVRQIDVDPRTRAGERKWLRAVFLFANYRTEGPHRIRIQSKRAAIRLTKDDVGLVPAGSGEARQVPSKRSKQP